MTNDMWFVYAVIQPFKLESVTRALEQIEGFSGVTVTECKGFGREKLLDQMTPKQRADSAGRDEELVDFTAKVKLEIAVSTRATADLVVQTIARTAHTGRRGDGRVMMWPLGHSVRIRTMSADEPAP